MKTIRVETKGGGVFILKECTAFGIGAIAHTRDKKLCVYEIQEGDKLTELS